MERTTLKRRKLDETATQPQPWLKRLGYAALILLCMAGAEAAAQSNRSADDVPTAPRSAQSSESPDVSMSAGQILRLIQGRPEITIELKRLLAERMRDSGVPLQEDSISDEALLRRISSDPDFRSSVTLLLRARGYVSADDLDRAQETRSASSMSTDPLSLDPTVAVPETYRNADLLGNTDILNANPRQDPLNSDLDTVRQTERFPSTPQRSARPALSQSRDENQPSAQTRLYDPSQPAPDRQPDTGPEFLRKPAPYNLLALRDLYTQVPAQQQHLTRFGSEVFLRRGGSVQSSALDLPLGPDYVLGAGDVLTVNIWGGVSQTLSRTIDSSGEVTLPEVGPVRISGLSLEQAQSLLQRTLAPQFRNAHVQLSLARFRTLRIYVVGDVLHPGGYDLQSLSTPLNALYAAGGPSEIGSMRTLRHLRGATVIADIDLYDFLLHGVRASSAHLQSGDTIFVPPAGPQVAVTGSVKRPAIYELKGETTLAQLLEMAGGVQVSAALRHVSVERIVTNDHRETMSVGNSSNDVSAMHLALEKFHVMDGDRVVVAPIVPWSDRAVYVEGHVVRPGRFAFQDGMVLTDVISSFNDLLPEPSEHGEIVRLVPPDLHAETIEFDLRDALSARAPIPLQPFDTIRITGRYETDAPKVTVRGEVLRPGVYALSGGMTASQLVKMAGGFTRSALRTDADLASYDVQNGKSVASRRTSIQIGEALQHSGSAADLELKPGDVLTVHQVSGWNDIGASVRLNGEVTYPGTYGLQEGEKLSSVLRRAGGFRTTAYPMGAILLRVQVRDLEEKSRAELIHQIETTSVSAKLGPNIAGQDQTSTLQLLMQQQEQVLQRLRSQPSAGRLVIGIGADITTWENTDADVEMRGGDVLIIPKRPGFILVSGQVYNASALTFVPHKTAGWYLKNAGGTSDLANSKEIFIVRANGSVVGRRSGNWRDNDVLSTKLDAGDTIVVPQKIIGGSMFWRNALTTAQLFSSIAIPLAIAGI